MRTRTKRIIAILAVAAVASTGQAWAAAADPISGPPRCCCDPSLNTPADPTVAI